MIFATDRSWRHTPLRKRSFCASAMSASSWRHTPLRNCVLAESQATRRSWRHTPLRKIFRNKFRLSGMFMATYAT
uniref:hypothetical protein n=1 Tax=Acinetobacter ursingii TaxID=108980 RepID=UPI00396AAD2D